MNSAHEFLYHDFLSSMSMWSFVPTWHPTACAVTHKLPSSEVSPSTLSFISDESYSTVSAHTNVHPFVYWESEKQTALTVPFASFPPCAQIVAKVSCPRWQGSFQIVVLELLCSILPSSTFYRYQNSILLMLLRMFAFPIKYAKTYNF